MLQLSADNNGTLPQFVLRERVFLFTVTDSGFRVKSQTQVHRKNTDSMMPTARVLNDMGVSEIRIKRTT